MYNTERSKKAVSLGVAITKTIQIDRITDGVLETLEDVVVVERAIDVFIENRKAFSATLSDSSIDLLLIGRLFSEGIIQKATDILQISSVGDRYDVFLRGEGAQALGKRGGSERDPERACENEHKQVPPNTEKKEDAEKYKIERLLSLMKEFLGGAAVFQETGGVHRCGLSDGHTLLFAVDDIGRHNAVDKTIGFSLRQEFDPTDKLLYTSGRTSLDIVVKAWTAGFAGIVSKSAATDLAVETARRHGLLLIGFARGNRCNLYAGENRVEN